MKLLTLLYALGLISAMQIAPERHEIEYFNHKYLKNLTITFRKLSRTSPHYVNIEIDSTTGVGNNLTPTDRRTQWVYGCYKSAHNYQHHFSFKVHMELFEFLGGHYIPTGIVGAYKLCDFLYKEPFFGKMYAKQLPGNWSCPFPPGQYHFMNLTIHLENFPYNIPFTYSSMIVRTRADVKGTLTATNEEIFRWKTFIKITQKMKDSKKKT